MILSVDKIDRRSTESEKLRPWQQDSTTNHTIVKTGKKYQKCKYKAECIVNINIWVREITLGGIESVEW